MINVSQTIKNSCKADKNTHTEYIVINGQTIYISGKLSATAYKDTTFFGTFNMKVLQFETENSTQFRNREFEYYKVIDGNAFKVGSFITTQVVDNDSKENIKVTANDYALKFAIPYTSQLDYESEQVTLYDVLKECCDNAGVELENEYITNGTFVVDNNQFVNGEMIGDVICAIAGISGNFATITDNDKLKLTFLNGTGELQTTTIDGSSTINASELKDIELKAKTTQASTPTPSSPQEVVNVTGRQEIKAVGKNLFNKDTENYKKGYYLNSSGVETSGTNWGVYYIPVEPNTSYTISGCQTNGGVNFCWFNSSKGFISNIGQKQNRTNITSPNNASYLGLSIVWNTTSGAYDGTTFMVEQNSSASTYEPYQEQVNIINLGKNLINPSSAYTGTSNGIATTYNTDQSLSYSGTTTSTWAYLTNKINISLKAGDYTFSRTKSLSYTAVIRLFRDASNYQDVTILASTTSRSATITNDIVSYQIYIASLTSGTALDETLNFQLEKGTQATSYSEYFTPIELCKIGTYEDKIFKTSGKNLFDKDNINLIADSYVDSSGNIVYGANNKFNWVKLEPSTTYTLSQTITSNVNIRIGLFSITPARNVTGTVLGTFSNGNPITQTFTTTSTSIYLGWVYCNTGNLNNHTEQQMLDSIMIEKSSSATDYEPYGYNEWYVKKNIGKLILDGSENWNNDGGTQGTDYRHNIYYAGRMTIPTALGTNNTYLSNYFTPRNSGSDAGELGSFYMSNSWLVFVDKNKVYDLAQWKTWLGTNKPIVYYVQATPTYTKLNDTLQKQLTDIKTMPLFSGVNNITTTAPFNITYIDNNIEILEDYTDLDDKRDTQPITSVSIGTSQVEGQEAVLKDEGMIALYGEHWLILNDNPFAYTLDKRQELVTALFNKVKGFGYSSFTSKYTYRPYLELGDKIKFKNKAGNLIDSVILRYEMDFDDCTFEAPSITSATIDYEAVPSTEALARRAEIIANQATAQINAVVTEQNDLEDRVDKAEATLDTQGARLDIVSTHIDQTTGDVLELKRTNYEFGGNGIVIESDEGFKSIKNTTGDYYYEQDTMIGKYTKDGSVQKDLALFGKYYYGIDEELDVESFSREDALFLAQLYTDSNNEDGFGHFWNGE